MRCREVRRGLSVAPAALVLELALPGPEFELALARLDDDCTRTRQSLLDLLNGEEETLRQSA
jgi:hypothetical protein